MYGADAGRRDGRQIHPLMRGGSIRRSGTLGHRRTSRLTGSSAPTGAGIPILTTYRRLRPRSAA